MFSYLEKKLIDNDQELASMLEERFERNESLTLNTINPHSAAVSLDDEDFNSALNDSDILIPDGIGIVFLENIFNSAGLRRYTGFDMFNCVMGFSSSKSLDVMFVGSTDSTLSEIERKIGLDWPGVNVSVYSPPFKEVFTQEDLESIIYEINNSNSRIVFIGLTAPKQEKLAYFLKKKCESKIFCSIGAVFDFYAGTIERPNLLWRRFNLEWLGRLMKEPKRLWKRTLVSSFKFLFWYVYDRRKKS